MSVRRIARKCLFESGSRVKSKAIGNRAEFIGTIVEEAPGGFLVRDDEGRLWLRNSLEIKPASESVSAS